MTPPSPERLFASDNAAGAHPVVLDALVAANTGHALAYGADEWTQRARRRFTDLFDAEVEVLFCWGGTGANVVGLQCLLAPYEAVICTDSAHINVDECGAAERFVGCKLIDLPTPDGKLRPADIERQLHALGDEHHVQPKVVSVTQSTELGTVYSPAELAELCELAHANGLLVHMDGARIANAAAVLDGDLRATTLVAGVDVLTFGGTKNGLVYGEAVVFFRPELAKAARFVRKQCSQLPSKMRFVAAQFEALLTDDLWLRNATHANAMAQRLYDAVASVPGVGVRRRPEVNSLFVTLPLDAIERLTDWSFFWVWDAEAGLVRWMTSFDTTEHDVDAFAAGVSELLAG
jgi:threonine aldolase